jgi:threonine synthase
VAVDDASIIAWQRRLARTEGIFCEPTSAAAFAGLDQLIQRGVVCQGEEALLPITGSGLKEPLPT